MNEFVEIVDQAQNEAIQLTQQLKLYEDEIESLKTDN